MHHRLSGRILSKPHTGAVTRDHGSGKKTMEEESQGIRCHPICKRDTHEGEDPYGELARSLPWALLEKEGHKVIGFFDALDCVERSPMDKVCDIASPSYRDKELEEA